MLAEELQSQPDALVRLFDLQQMTRAFDKAVIEAALGAKRLVRRASGRRAFKIRIAADELDRPAKLGCLRPKIQRERLRVDRCLILRRARQLIAAGG